MNYKPGSRLKIEKRLSTAASTIRNRSISSLPIGTEKIVEKWLGMGRENISCQHVSYLEIDFGYCVVIKEK